MPYLPKINLCVIVNFSQNVVYSMFYLDTIVIVFVALRQSLVFSLIQRCNAHETAVHRSHVPIKHRIKSSFDTVKVNVQ